MLQRISSVINSRHRRAGVGRLLATPEGTLLGGFAGVILFGAFLLWLPWLHVSERVGFIEALFTATSAVCVTGLIVVDTATDFNHAGQIVILALIQVGGLGIMTLAAMAFHLAGRRLSLQSQALVSDSFFQRDIATEFRAAFRRILILTFAIESVGALLLFLFLSHRWDDKGGAFSAVFHSISAFCNAGFSVYTDNLLEIQDSQEALVVVMVLIVLGGLGYAVINEIWVLARERCWRRLRIRPTRLSLHCKLVFLMSTLLIFGGAVGLVVFGVTPAGDHWADGLFHALFQSVTARTAGFNSVDMAKLPSASLFILVMLMFVGGSPGSCAGGVKTTALAIWLSRLHGSVHGRTEVRLLDRRIPPDLVNRADMVLGLAVFWNILGILFLLGTQSHLAVRPLDLIFEQVSAFGTVGLSTGLTPNLSTVGKLWICVTMFVGRLGPVTVAMWMFSRESGNVSYPKGTVMIG